jgi:transcriptional regulator with XRE-family HTH domain
MTQGQLAEALGKGQSQVSKWETGSAHPPAEAWMRMGNIADHEDAAAYYVCAGMEERRANTVSKAIRKILHLIGSEDSALSLRVERQIAGMELDDQLEHVLQAILNLPPRETETREAFFNKLKTATEELERATQRLKSELEK